MQMIKIGSAFLFLFSLSALGQNPTPLVTVVVTPNPITENQSVQLRIEVETVPGNTVFQPHFDAPDFILVGPQPSYGGSITTQYFNGQTQSVRKSFFEYVLNPKKTGNLVIRNIKIKVGKEEITSPDTMVKVLADTSTPLDPAEEEEDDPNPAAPGYSSGSNFTPPPDDAPKQFNSDFTVFASINKKRAYVGEPIVIEYWLYDFGGLRQIEIQKWPTFGGFWKEDLEIASTFNLEEVYIGDRMARRAFIGRYALHGIKPGKISLDRLVIRGRYLSRISTQGYFQTQELRTGMHGSQDITVEILPLPLPNRPEKFSGAVGDFFLKAEADKTTVAQHTPITFTVTVQGVGNFQAIDSIPLPLPPEFELYESKTNARGSNPIGTRRELRSQKTFQITAVPRKAGTFVVEPITWWYFNPEKGSYQKATTSPITIQVAENAGQTPGTNTYATGGGAPYSPPAEELRPLKDISLTKANNLPRQLNVFLIILCLLNAWLGWLWLHKTASAYLKVVLRDPFREAKLEWARAKTETSSAWLSRLEDSIFAAGEVLLGSNPRGITRVDLETHWREKNLPLPLFHQIALVLDHLDQHRFSAKAQGQENEALRTQLQNEVEAILKEAAKVKRRYLASDRT